MKIIYSFLLLSTLFGFSTNVHASNYQWAKSVGGINDDRSLSIATDLNGNVLVTGFFDSPTITFGTTVLTNSGGDDIYVVKYDSSGNVLWAKSFGGIYFDSGNSITTDPDGNVLVTGYFYGDTLFLGPDTLTIDSALYDKLFVVKFDASGNILWAKSNEGALGCDGYGICSDANGFVLVTGNFLGDTVIFETHHLTSAGGNEIFVVKYDTLGYVRWAKSAGGVSNDYSTGISTDANGNVLVTGYFDSPTITFGTITLTNSPAGGKDIFIAKYSSSGNVLWAKSAGGSFDDYSYGVTTDKAGNVFLTGTFAISITFGIDTFINYGGYDSFIVKYDSSGNVIWAKSAIGSNSIFSLRTDTSGNIFATGFFNDTIIFGTTILTSTNNQDIFIVKYDASGNDLWSVSAGTINTEYSKGISVDASGNIFITGYYFSDTLTFGSFPLINSYYNSSDIFIVRVDDNAITGIAEKNNAISSITVFPNPGDGQINIRTSTNIDEIKVTNIFGKSIYQSKQIENNFSFQIDEAGIYFIQFRMRNQMVTKKIIVSR